MFLTFWLLNELELTLEIIKFTILFKMYIFFFFFRELVLLTKKQPNVNFSEIAKLAAGIKNLHQTCCEGNAVACVFGRVRSSVFSKLTLTFKILIILTIREEEWGEDEEVKGVNYMVVDFGC